MAKSNIDRIGEALNLFRDGLRPFVVRHMESRHGKDWKKEATKLLAEGTRGKVPETDEEWDASAIVNLIQSDWQYNFRKQLDNAHRNLLYEVREIRNGWAHQRATSTQDAVRALDTIKRALDAVSASEQAAKVDALHQETMRVRFQEMQRSAAASARKAAVAGEPMAGLRPWREIIQPHPDVAKGEFSTSEFAADLAQVHRGGAPDEYGDPKAFFRRTYLTDGLKALLTNAVKRLNGKGGHPVIELQTNFGGGKTHSMLALYHLVSKGVKPSELAGVDTLLAEAGLGSVPKAERAVLVGTALAPGQPEKTREGIELRTLWGRLAYQLAGPEGYKLLAGCDENGSAPGSDDLVKLFTKVGPCVILIDEWVAYCRQMYETPRLPGGTFDANLTFAQALTEAVKAAPTALLVASLPQSQIEVGGEGGKAALARLENTFGRLEFNWQPANQDESYEIVRRRLFEPIAVEDLPSRDAVIGEFASMYSQNAEEYPSECRELAYEHKLANAYPIHPEVFDRLYQDWSRLEQFQRTRGVLRLMAATIHHLWVKDDRSLLIMPSHVPLDEQDVRDELTRHSGTAKSQWDTIIHHDVDGPASIPMQLDKEVARYGKVSAARRAARTIFLCSAPVGDTSQRGSDIRRVRVGCVQPGENPPTFTDATRALADKSSHLYVDQSRYWYDDQPNVNRTAADRAAQLQDDDVLQEIRNRLAEQTRVRGPFAAVHICPESTGDVPDDRSVRLVVLDPKFVHMRQGNDSAAERFCFELLEKRGNSPRLYRNALVFLAPDRPGLDSLKQAVRDYLAWSSVVRDYERLQLTPLNHQLAKSKCSSADNAVKIRLCEAYGWLLIPTQPDPLKPVQLESVQQRTQEPFAERAGQRLERDGTLNTTWSGTLLRKSLDERLWKERPHAKVRDLADYFAQYVYLERLASPDVLFRAIQSGVAGLTWFTDGFAYADAFDELKGRYQGLVVGTSGISVRADDQTVLVKPEAAKAQLDREVPVVPGGGAEDRSTSPPGNGSGDPEETKPTVHEMRRFYGTVELDPTRAARDVGRIATEVIAHLVGRETRLIRITLDLEVTLEQAADESLQRIVLENCKVLGFGSFGFEGE